VELLDVAGGHVTEDLALERDGDLVGGVRVLEQVGLA
jgi:hypothetical protein